MFERLFKRPSVIARHASAPYTNERAKYLLHCLEREEKLCTVQEKASELLWIARKLKHAYADLHLTSEQIQVVAGNWKARSRALDTPNTQRYRIRVARSWLRFLGYLKQPPLPFRERLDGYCRWAREERGLSEATITGTYEQVRHFLFWFRARGRPLSSVRIDDVDAYLAHGSRERSWNRMSVCNVARGLRAFFRYGAAEGFSPQNLAALIRGPRLYALEGLPQGPSWPDVERLLTSLDTTHPKDVRDRAVLMLFALYGLRRSEVVRLRLEDIDWEQDLMHVTRAKGGGRHTYPLLPSVGNAILKYLLTVRPPCRERALFLAFATPPRAVKPGTLYALAAARLRTLRVPLSHWGPHCLRHACATHLLAEEVSMKAIGDHLGHRSAFATRTYAKVDMPGLRQVAAFDLGALP